MASAAYELRIPGVAITKGNYISNLSIFADVAVIWVSEKIRKGES